jgi:hypothetical protein
MEMRAMNNTQDESTFESWALVELFGHQKIAGLVTEAVIGGCNLIRVDVPESEDQSAYTRYFGQGAIYGITPVSEEIARSALAYIRPRPVSPYMLPQSKADDTSSDDFDAPYKEEVSHDAW